VAQPQAPKHRVVALLVQEQLPPESQPHVDLAELVNVRRVAERAREARQVEHAALAYVDEEADVLLASFRFSINPS
jgi:hypothetical protein